MVFKKVVELNTENLTQETRYRFAEIEIFSAINVLSELFKNEPNSRQRASQTIFKAISTKAQNFDGSFEDRFNQTFQNLSAKPRKDEFIDYCRHKNMSYNLTGTIAKAGPNLIASRRYTMPFYYPSFDKWDENLLINWDNIKHTINMFNIQLPQNKE